MTIKLYQDNAYQKQCNAVVVSVTAEGDVITDQTVFYPAGGGQPGDKGVLTVSGRTIQIITTIKDNLSDHIVHKLAEGEVAPLVGDKVRLEIDWLNRYRYMRMHTALHLLCAVIPCGVTGGQIGIEKSRLDFDIGDLTLDKIQITESLNQLVEQSHSVTSLWIEEQALDNQPELIRTMSVKPPKGAGKIRLLKVGDNIDLQPCGGTHIKNTSEIGQIKVSKIENKGKRNRRVNIVFVE